MVYYVLFILTQSLWDSFSVFCKKTWLILLFSVSPPVHVPTAVGDFAVLAASAQAQFSVYVYPGQFNTSLPYA